MRRLTIEVDNELYARLMEVAEIRHQSPEDTAAGLLRQNVLFDFPRINTGGFTEIAKGHDLRKNWFWDVLDDAG